MGTTRPLRILALLAVLLAAPGVALACRCLWAGPFVTVALGTELVVLGEVRGHALDGMDVAVLDVLQGTEGRPLIRVWGDDGGLCRPYVTLYPRGTRWVFALGREPGSRDYAISGCGAFWLAVRGDRAFGSLTAAARTEPGESVRLSQLVAWIRSRGATPLAPVSP